MILPHENSWVSPHASGPAAGPGESRPGGPSALHHLRGKDPRPPADALRRRHARRVDLEPDAAALGDHRDSPVPQRTPAEEPSMTRPCAMFVLCLATLIAAVGEPTDTSADRKMLRGLQGVSVLLEALHPDVERLAFSAQQLQADIELRLRRAGVPILLTGTEPI